jgi:hypothetical protein
MGDNDPPPPDPFVQPDPGDYNYRPLLESIRDCRTRVGEMMANVGRRTQIYVESEQLLHQLDTVARLTRVPAAVRFVRRRVEPRPE